jgi:low temperature requirement protein LtrA
MYLMYFIGESTRFDWAAYQAQYHIAWALILINIGMQYVIELRNHEADVWNRGVIKHLAVTLFVEAAIVLAAAFVSPSATGPLSFAAIFIGMIMSALGRKVSAGGMVDFSHLTERAMLYVVFTFGEMIIVVASYFVGDGIFDWNVIYFSLMAFLIVVGLFISYEIFYDHLLDRDRSDNGFMYMMTHLFMLFALGCTTVSLEFMRNEEVALMPKIIFITAAIIAYYFFLFCLGAYTKRTCCITKGFILKMNLLTAAFAVLMLTMRENMRVNIVVAVAYIFIVVNVVYKLKLDSAEGAE